MSSETITFKLVVEKDQKTTGDIRRVTLSTPVKYNSLVSAAEDLLGADEVKFRYFDDDGDRIVLSSQYELDTAIGLTNTKNTVRLLVEVVKAKSEPVPVPVPEKKEEKKEEEKPEEKEPEVKIIEEPAVEVAVEEKKPEEIPSTSAATAAAASSDEEPAPEAEKKEEEQKPAPFADFFRSFNQIPGVNCSHDPNGTGVVDIDFSKLFSPENGENVWAKISEALGKVAQIAAEQQKQQEAAFVQAMKPDESAGVYSHVIHTMPTSVVHHCVICDGCGKRDIPGMRYKCANCPDYDLCQDCIRRADTIHDPSHMFYPICFPLNRGPHCRPFHPCAARFMGRPHVCRRPMPNVQPQPAPQPQPQPAPAPAAAPEKKPEPQPVPQPASAPAPAPEKKPEPQPAAEKKPSKYAYLNMTRNEKKMVRALMDMGFPNVELDLYHLRANGGVINDNLIETLVRYNV